MLDFLRSVDSEPIHWFPLDTFVHEICCFERPTIRQIAPPDLHLLVENLLPILLPGFPSEWPFPVHEFVDDDSNSEVVNSDSVVLLAEDFRCHVSRSSAGVNVVVGLPNPCDS